MGAKMKDNGTAARVQRALDTVQNMTNEQLEKQYHEMVALNADILAEYGKVSLALAVYKFKEYKQEADERFKRVTGKLEKETIELREKLELSRQAYKNIDDRLKHLENPNGLK